MPPVSDVLDVAVLGGGNAGLCAAISASRRGARVAVIESAPQALRGGNSRHTRNLRCMHDAPTDILTDAYGEDEFVADLIRVTEGRTDEALARLTVRGSAECPAWIRSIGGRLQPSLRGTLQLGRTNAFFLGGGKALMNSYYAAAERLGVRVCYGAEVVGLEIADGRFQAAIVGVSGRAAGTPGGSSRIAAKTAVLASGGFESNLEWLRDVWGAAADNFIIRGTPYNTGKVLREMLDGGAQPVGDPSECHAIAVDARAPRFDGGIVTRLDSVPLGIVVNSDGNRFYDEGEDYWPRRYAIWGRLIARQPGQIAYSIVDAKVNRLFMPSVFPPRVACSIAELSAMLGLEAGRVTATVDAFNRAVRPGAFDHTALDGCRTEGLSPDKTHWAQRIDTPPFWGYPLRPGITFTYLGVKVDEQARVLMRDGRRATNIFAAGEIMAGNILGRGYVAGVGMTIGTVFGRIAGREAAACAAG